MAQSVRFPQYLKKHGPLLIFNSSEAFAPGLIVNRKGSSFFKVDALDRLLVEPGLSWKTKLLKADLPDSIEGRKKVEANGSVNLPFLGIKGGLKKKISVETGAKVVVDKELKIVNVKGTK